MHTLETTCRLSSLAKHFPNGRVPCAMSHFPLQIAEREYELATHYNPSYWEAHHRLARLLAGSTPPAQPQKTEQQENTHKKHAQDRARLQKVCSFSYHTLSRWAGTLTTVGRAEERL